MVRLKQKLDAEGFRFPIRIDGAGRSTGGGLLSRGHIYKILSNPIYVGRLPHKGQVHEDGGGDACSSGHSLQLCAPCRKDWLFVRKEALVSLADGAASARSGAFIAHDYPTLLGAAIRGVGLAQVPGPLAKAPIADGRLEALLAPFAVTTPGVFLYHPGKRQMAPKLRAFIEHVKHRSGNRPIGRRLRKVDIVNGS